jgi:hypothetical protein
MCLGLHRCEPRFRNPGRPRRGAAHQHRFLAISPQLTADLADPNFVGVPGGPRTTFAVAGYQAMIRPLSPGSHTITVTHLDSPFAPLVQHAVINVVPGHEN